MLGDEAKELILSGAYAHVATIDPSYLGERLNEWGLREYLIVHGRARLSETLTQATLFTGALAGHT